MSEGTDVREFRSSVSPKGQFTLPVEVRRQLGIKPKDTVSIRLDDGVVMVRPARSRLDDIFQSVPALKRPRTDREMTDLAWEEHVQALTDEDAEDQ